MNIFHLCIATHMQVTQKPANLHFFQVRGRVIHTFRYIHDTYPNIHICARMPVLHVTLQVYVVISQTHILIRIHAVIHVQSILCFM